MTLSTLKRTLARAVSDTVAAYADSHGFAEAHRVADDHGRHVPRVAVLDTGVSDRFGVVTDGAQVVARERFSAGTGVGHGTKTASVAVGSRFGGSTPVRVLSGTVTATGVNPDAERGALPEAIRWAVDHGADVAVMALAGHPESRAAERAAIEYAVDRGVVLLASTGNDDRGRACFPARHPDVLAVGATDTVGGRATLPFTSVGSNWPADVCAWGFQVPAFRVGLSEAGESRQEPTDFSGTSAAVATVAHAAALVRRVAPDLSPAAVREVLVSTADPLTTDHPIGPRVDAAGAVRAAAERDNSL